jgi:hypothetical protein
MTKKEVLIRMYILLFMALLLNGAGFFVLHHSLICLFLFLLCLAVGIWGIVMVYRRVL